MKYIIFVSVLIVLYSPCPGLSTNIELTKENMEKEGYEISIAEDKDLITFIIKWNGILKIPINEDNPRTYYETRHGEEKKKVEVIDYVYALPINTEAFLRIKKAGNIISDILLGISSTKPILYFQIHKDYMKDSEFSLRQWAYNLNAFDGHWFNLEKIYLELKGK